MRLFLYESVSAGDAQAPSSLRAQGIAMRNAVLDDLLSLPGVQVSCVMAPPAPPGCTPVLPDPGEDPVAFVRRVAAAHDAAWIIAPESQGLLAALHGAVDPARWIGCDGATIRVASSKRATLQRLHAFAVTTPLALGTAARWVVKPDDGAGCSDTRVFADRARAEADQARRPGSTLEPYVEGEALSVALLARQGEARVLACNRQRLHIDAQGHLHYDGVDTAALDRAHDARLPALRRLAQQVVAALPGLGGFVGIDVVWHAQYGAVAIEVNPRVTCAYAGLAPRLGLRPAAEILQAWRATVHQPQEVRDAQR